jgi:hypothetical protein
MGGAHEHPEDHGTSHGTSTGYLAVLAVGLLELLLGLLPKGAQLRLGLATRWSAVLNPGCGLHLDGLRRQPLL